MRTRSFSQFLFVAVFLCTETVAAPQVISKYGIDFCVVGAPGNRAANQTEAPDYSRGAVNYTYAIGRTEITNGQWFEFVNAYGKYVDPLTAGTAFTSTRGIARDLGNESGWQLLPGGKNLSAEIGWRYAAIYCNWLTNGKANELWAFQSGAYDISTFQTKPNGALSDQIVHSPGAKFWIPSLDEWIKAVYYDPNRYGTGLGGYWPYSNSQSTQLVKGPPGAGQTSAGTRLDLPVGSYPTIQSPWGLLDTSGSSSEWTEEPDNSNSLYNRIVIGSSRTSGVFEDFLGDGGILQNPNGMFAGLRLATDVPSPAGLTGFVLFASLRMRRRRTSAL